MTTQVLDAAQHLAHLGYHVFPVNKEKKPYTENGFKAATSDPDSALALFAQYNRPQIAIATGASGLFVIDVDCKNRDKGEDGYASLRAMQDDNEALPDTVTARTPSGGQHFYYRGEGKSTHNTLGLGIDTRSTGGYVVCPPSQMSNGAYTWATSLLDAEPAPAPLWLTALATSLSTTTKGVDSTGRNCSLTSLAGTLVNAGFTGDGLACMLLEANKTLSNPLPHSEVLKIARSVSRYPAKSTSKNDTDLAEELGMNMMGEYAWDSRMNRWMGYQTKLGIWQRVDDDDMRGQIARGLKSLLGEGQNLSRINAVEKLMRPHLKAVFDNQPGSLLPVANGVLELETLELRPHREEDYFTWAVPYGYDPAAGCPKTQAWLGEAMGGDSSLVEVLRAYLRAIVLGRADLQVYLEAYGPGGSGKGTFSRLAMALIGFRNVHTTKLKELEHGRFETACLYGKRLMLVNEADSYTSEPNVLKSITGGDAVRIEEKFKPIESFVFEGMVLICGNQAMKSSEYTSGLARRRLPVPFRHASKQDRRLLEMYREAPCGELADELAGVLNWVLAMPEERMREILRPYGRGVAALGAATREVFLDTNHIANWGSDHLVVDPEACTPLKQLYDSFTAWAKEHGVKGFGSQQFSTHLIDLAQNQYAYPNVTKAKQKTGVQVYGLRFRLMSDETRPQFGE